MKTADIEVGREYAARSERYPDRVKVLAIEKDGEKRIRDAQTFSGRGRPSKGTWIRVQFVGHRNDREELLKPQQIREPWEDYAERKERHQQAERQRRTLQDEAVKVLEGALEETGLDLRVYSTGRGGVGISVPNLEKATALADLISLACKASDDR